MQPLPDAHTVASSLPSIAGVDQLAVARLIERAAAAARHHTGGSGFAPDGKAVDRAIAELLVHSVGRAMSNPECSLVGDEGPFSLRPGSFADWSHEEYAVLEQYRTGVRPDDAH